MDGKESVHAKEFVIGVDGRSTRNSEESRRAPGRKAESARPASWQPIEEREADPLTPDSSADQMERHYKTGNAEGPRAFLARAEPRAMTRV